MHDDQLRGLLRTLDDRGEPDPAFSDALFERLSLVARDERRTRGMMVLLAAALLTAALAVGSVVGSGLVSLPWTSEATPTPAPVTNATPSPVATRSPSPSASPSPPQGEIGPDTVVRTTVDGLRVRTSFATASDSLGVLPNGTIGLVIAGPTMAEGQRWYLLAAPGLPYGSPGCGPVAGTGRLTCPDWFGWVAGADADGTAGLAPMDVPGGCPSDPTVEGLGAMAPAFRLACYGDGELTVVGFYPEIPEDAGLGGACAASDRPAGWLICHNINHDYLAVDEAGDSFGPLRMSFDPTDGIARPDRGQWLEVTGHFDHPASGNCGIDPGPNDPALLIFNCRTEFVAMSVRVASGP